MGLVRSLFYLWVLISACQPGIASAQETVTDWRSQIGTLRLGIVARPDIDESAETEIGTAFSAALGIEVEVRSVRDQPALIDAQAAGRIDYAVYSAIGYATAWRLCACVEPLVAPTGTDSSIGIRSILIARGQQSAARNGFASGDIIHLLHDDLARPQNDLVEAGSAEMLERMLEQNQVSAIFGWSSVDAAGLDTGDGTPARLDSPAAGATARQVVWRSDIIPYGPHAIRRSLPREIRPILQQFLMGLDTSHPRIRDLIEPRRSGGFRPVVHEDYKAAVEVVRRVARDEEQGGTR